MSTTFDSRSAPSNAAADADELGVVVIGRNEGERLRRCLASLAPAAVPVVYVDSGSTDGSPVVAAAMGAMVVELDLAVPFTAARARNAGFRKLRASRLSVARVQFVDGDCELIDGWLGAARGFLADHGDVGVVFGRLRERHPEQSVYNLMCDLEWDRPVGPASASGGIAMMRVAMFDSLGGFREDLVACEEYELCLRARRAGWKVWSLAVPMAWHDAAMFRFGQWWTRSARTGYGHAHTASLERSSLERSLRERERTAQLLRPWFWALLLPLFIAIACALVGSMALLLLLIYPLQVVRTMQSIDGTLSTRLARAGFLTLGKFPELHGQLRFWASRRRARAGSAFDYKS